MIREQVFIFFMKACSFYFMLCVILKLFTEKTDYSLPEGYIIMIIEERLQKQLRRASILVFGIIAVFFICGGLFSAYLRRIKNETMQEQVAAEAEEYKIRILKQLEADLQTLSSMAAVLKDVEDMQKMSEYLDEVNQSNAFFYDGLFQTGWGRRYFYGGTQAGDGCCSFGFDAGRPGWNSKGFGGGVIGFPLIYEQCIR